MLIADTVAIKGLQLEEGVKRFDFYRCYSCRRVFTREAEERAFREAEKTGDCRICKCGATKYTPTRPVGLEWFGVMGYVRKLVLARAVAPFAERRAPFVMPFLERLCS
jgi:hypothetical protein